MKWFLAGIFLGVVIAGIFFATAQVQEDTPAAVAQVGVPTATNIQVRNGSNLGEGIISWDAVPQATHYRIGYVNMEIDYHLAKASCTGEWIDAFVYVDANAQNIPVRSGRAEYTIRHLVPGARHAFTVLTSNNFTDSGDSVSSEFSWPVNTRWQFLDGRNALPSGITLPTGECTPVTASTPTPPTPTPMAAPTPTRRPTPTPTRAPVTNGDYDADNDGLIEVYNLAQLNAIRWDPDGDGYVKIDVLSKYVAAFSGAADDMGCPISGCIGYELATNLDFDTNHNGRADEGDTLWNAGNGWDPIYLGDGITFDGGGYDISNLYIYRPNENDTGLFSTNDGIIANVGLVNVDVTGDARVGGLAGKLQSGSIVGSRVTGSVTGQVNVGGLVGYNSQSITASSADVNVTGKNSVGGLVGYNSGAWSEDEMISDSVASGITTGKNNIGGLVGSNQGVIRNSAAQGNVFGTYYVGGLVGHNDNVRLGNFISGVIDASNARGNVTGVRYLGSLVGINIGGSITNSHGTGSVTRTN